MQHQLSLSGVLAAWETGAARRPLDRALAVLWAAGAGGPDPAGLALTERDRRLLAIRAGSFGPTLEAVAACPGCGAEMEMTLDARALAAALPEGDDDAAGISIRPLTSRDLAAVAGLDAAEATAALRRRLAGKEAPPGEVDRRIEAAAEAAELRARIACAACGAEWTETLDVAEHVWAAVETAALRLLGEVAELAAAYGWSEAEILGLGPARRAAYLSRARA